MPKSRSAHAKIAFGSHAKDIMRLDIFRVPGYKQYLGLSFHSFLERAGRRIGLVLIVVVAAAYGVAFFFGPQGFQALLEKRREIRQLQDQNAAQARENEQRRERIRRLEESRSEQEMEIRKQLKLARPGETTFILPDPPKEPAPAPPAARH